MHPLIPFLVFCCFALLGAKSHADIYSDVNRLVGAQEWAKAQLQAEQHLKTQPTDPQMRLLMSRIQDGQGQAEAAMATLQGLTQSFPELPEPHNNLAALLAHQESMVVVGHHNRPHRISRDAVQALQGQLKQRCIFSHP
jgi:non-ribosomal peptide synthetase component F